ncbi:MAG TPA: sulfatase-like hydrolase/transferase [Saprospiraceae bacterium]|nr:sulfatase-like hydrolase/transferase [Saprospiraceae bacterium]
MDHPGYSGLGKNNRRVNFLPALSILFCLQWLLYLPLYLAKQAEGSFLPAIESFSNLVSRQNPDVFRWSLDYGFVLALLALPASMSRQKWMAAGTAFLYLMLFLFQAYFHFSWKVYGEIPVWTYDWALIKRVLPVFMKSMRIPPFLAYALLALLLALFYVMVYRGHRVLSGWFSQNPGLKAWLIPCFVFFLPAGLYYTNKPVDASGYYPAIHWIARDMNLAFTSKRVKSLPDLHRRLDYEKYDSLPLVSKPNIYLLFIEAYGTVAGVVKPYNREYLLKLDSMQKRLAGQGWHSASALSNSTILGGRSWLGFTSLMSGVRIDNHPAYEKLLREFPQYPHLIRALNHQGYQTYRLNTMANFGETFEKLDSITQIFFDHRHWTRYSDLPYRGYRYDYFGGIPDQYALNYWDEYVLDKNQSPFFLFFITLNTHAPFYHPPPLLDDWKSLDQIEKSPHKRIRAEDGSPLERYTQGVIYDLSVLEKYILEKAGSNSLFILIGDHPPAGMEYLLNGATDTYATPIHLISKDPRWVRVFTARGFEPGMAPVFKKGSLLKHEGFYSLFMQAWAEVDSLPPSRIPAYLPYGIE